MDSSLCHSLLSLVKDLNTHSEPEERFDLFIRELRKIAPFDAASVMVRDGNVLRIICSLGLKAEARIHSYSIAQHPRLQVMIDSGAPVVFPPDSTLPDPFDDLLDGPSAHALHDVHSCLGCPLIVENQVVGCLTLDALSPGAFDHLPMLFLESLGAFAGAALRTALLMQRLERDRMRHMEWARELQKLQSTRTLIGDSLPMQKLRQEIRLVARSPFPVLILGETGTGKELVARSIHTSSGRADGPWITVNCAALPENLAESELFGHIRGAFTGADRDRPGKFELADGGTLFLDEIGDLSLPLQAKILRILQEGEVQRLGSENLLKINVRIIAATHRNLEHMVADGTFRRDLLHRLHVFPLRVPPLRERLDDLELLAATFVEDTCREIGLGSVRISPEVFDVWKAQDWPGNVRELQNRVRSTLVGMGLKQGESSIIQLQHIQDSESKKVLSPNTQTTDSLAKNFDSTNRVIEKFNVLNPNAPIHYPQNLSEAVDNYKTQLILNAYHHFGNNWSRAATNLGLDRANLLRLTRRLRIKESASDG